MAATRLIALHANKGKTIAQALKDRIDYVTNPEKTEDGALVSSYQCDPKTATEEFMLSKRLYSQITGKDQDRDVIAYQIRQSFKPGEITPEEANRLGYELAMRFTKGRYAFIVATHTDRAHIHNHVIFNSTAVDGTRKFKNFWLSGLAMQRCSDLICLENGYSVIQPKPYHERVKRTEYPKRETLRDMVCRDIGAVLEQKPKSFEAFLQLMQEDGYEVKRGKQISLRGKTQKRFIRLSSLPDGFTEIDIRNYIGQKAVVSKDPGKRASQPRQINLLIDIQAKLQDKGAAYKRWATVYNLKQMSKTLLFLRDHEIESMEQLEKFVEAKLSHRDELLEKIRVSEKRLKEISELKKQIITYSKTRKIYEEYRKSGYGKMFLEEHREEIMLHRAAKDTFDRLGAKKIPKVKELSEEYVQVLAVKKQAYIEYREVKDQLKEGLVAQQNVRGMYGEKSRKTDMSYSNEI